MKKADVLIITAPTKSGKTTYLAKWAFNRNDVAGILTPVINGKRFFHNISSNSFFEMEIGVADNSTFSIGNYIFSAVAFEKAALVLLSAITTPIRYLVIDEIGPLEMMQHKGFYNVFKELLNKTYHQLQIIVVVRESLIIEVTSLCEQYNKTVNVINFIPIINESENFLPFT
ncbi:MAG: hypothetical protein JSR09_07280 [Bacteroidetes bacterium]|nr:hypothetical protein [Bacteroidota bacterium]MBS1649496.1 hypothetical protein [Bacteroidota bacterium]